MDVREFARKKWPQGLREIPGNPERLFVRGTFPTPPMKFLTVVGSRAMTRYGREACEFLIRALAGYPVCIVSGLALGVDACAHKSALAAGLPTLAVLGSGLDDSVIGPRANFGLAYEILAAGGALVSEHEALHRARPYDFPARNRIMVGIADAVLLIEATDRSGTLITARLAGEYNRELLCVPHRIHDPSGFGAHVFLRLGATPVSEPDHLLEALGIEPRKKEEPEPQSELSGLERLVWERLENPATRDEILRAGGAGAGELLTALLTLELRGLAKEEFGAWRRR